MGLFNKNKKKDTTENENSGIKKEYKVILKEKLTKGTTRTIRTFEAGRWKDPVDGVVYLKSIENQKQKINFLEIFPADVKDFVKYSKEELQKKIKDSQEKYRAELVKDDPNINQKNFEFEIMKYEAQLRALEYNSDSSYFSFSEDAQPEIIYLRESDFFTPFKWDTETKTIYQPSEAKKKSVVSTLRNKENKYKRNDQVTAVAMILLIIGAVMTLGNTFLGLKLWSQYDESKIAELEAQGLNTLNYCSDVVAKTNQEVLKTGETLNNIVKTLEDKTPQPQITGITPQ
jgi:hypothetical protein